MIEAMTKQEILDEIICNNDGLYDEYDELKLLNNGYTEKELKAIAKKWIIDGDETG